MNQSLKKSLYVAAAGLALVGAASLGLEVASARGYEVENVLLAQANPKLSVTAAADKALAEAKSGQVSQVELKSRGTKLYYQVTVQDQLVETDYRLDANTGQILRTKAERLDADDALIGQTQKTIAEVEKAVLAQYPGAKMTDLALEKFGQDLIYEVTLLDQGREVELVINSRDLTMTAFVDQEDED